MSPLPGCSPGFLHSEEPLHHPLGSGGAWDFLSRASFFHLLLRESVLPKDRGLLEADHRIWRDLGGHEEQVPPQSHLKGEEPERPSNFSKVTQGDSPRLGSGHSEGRHEVSN